jgi:hypothetical protein
VEGAGVPSGGSRVLTKGCQGPERSSSLIHEFKEAFIEPDVVAHSCNPRQRQEDRKFRTSLGYQALLYTETLSQKNKNKSPRGYSLVWTGFSGDVLGTKRLGRTSSWTAGGPSWRVMGPPPKVDNSHMTQLLGLLNWESQVQRGQCPSWEECQDGVGPIWSQNYLLYQERGVMELVWASLRRMPEAQRVLR